MIELALAVLIGVTAGEIVKRLLRGKSKPEIEPHKGAYCVCGHPRAMHIDGKGKCQDLKFVKGTGAKLSHHIKCPCQAYDGPEPLPEYFARELG